MRNIKKGKVQKKKVPRRKVTFRRQKFRRTSDIEYMLTGRRTRGASPKQLASLYVVLET